MKRRLAVLKLSLVFSLLMLWAVPAPPAASQDQTLTGWFTFIVADYPSDTGLASETTYFLTEDSGERNELLIDVELMQPLGGPVALNRKRVTVVGEWEDGGPDDPERFSVHSIELAPLPSTTSPGRTFAPDVFPDEPPPPGAVLPATEDDSHLRGAQAWVTILCRFADATDETPYLVEHYETIMEGLDPLLARGVIRQYQFDRQRRGGLVQPAPTLGVLRVWYGRCGPRRTARRLHCRRRCKCFLPGFCWDQLGL